MQPNIESRPCRVIEVVSPKRVVLNGLWLGAERPKRVIVWVHGLGSSMFSKLRIMEMLVDSHTAVLTFNNRGHDQVARISHQSRSPKRMLKGGAAHEVFTDCIDDIEGAIRFAKRQGVKEIFLVGHSTGCQKSVYWASKKGRGVKGVVLLAPISDYSAEVKLRGTRRVARAARAARALVSRGKKHTFLPDGIWHETLDAQRFLSLYAGKGPEEIFTYWNPQSVPRTLQSVKTPLLVLLAEHDEYADRPARDIAKWFISYLKKSDRVEIIPQVEHGFMGEEARVAECISRFVSAR